MAAIIAILTGVAALVFWLGRAAQNAHHITDAANEIANLPRKMRYMKKAGKSGLSLVTDPREAACVLMIATARSSAAGTVTDAESGVIQTMLTETMGWPEDDAEDFVDSLRWLTRDIKQPDTVLKPMTKFLKSKLSMKEADELAHMMTEVALAEKTATEKQTYFIGRYREMMGLNSPVG